MLSDTPIYDASDAVFVERTGKEVAEWIDILDNWDALKKGHTKIAIFIEQTFEISPTWAQACAIRYQKEKYM